MLLGVMVVVAPAAEAGNLLDGVGLDTWLLLVFPSGKGWVLGRQEGSQQTSARRQAPHH